VVAGSLVCSDGDETAGAGASSREEVWLGNATLAAMSPTTAAASATDSRFAARRLINLSGRLINGRAALPSPFSEAPDRRFKKLLLAVREPAPDG
jgi:hypothetical protein